MSLSVAEEKAYYEERYSAFLAAPDDDLRFSPAQFLQDLENPTKEVFERRRLYACTLKELARLQLAGKRVLDYGCGTGDIGMWMATAEGARVTFLDLSDCAVRVCLRRAELSGVGELCSGEARDAADLSCFPAAHFDIVYGCASLHHTIKYPGAWSELLRVLKPGGTLVLTETYGNNPLLNALRRWNWKREQLPEEQGEDVIFNREHVAVLRESFEEVALHPMHLLTMVKRGMRGRFTQTPVRLLLRTLEATDAVLLAIAPALREHCGEVVVVARGRRG